MFNFFNIFHKKERIMPNVSPASTNLLVISDLHLGEDLSEFGSTKLLNLVSGLNHTFPEMIHYLVANRLNNRPWQMVLNGDTFDFLKVSLRSAPPVADSNWLENAPDQALKINTSETPETIIDKLNLIGQAYLPIMEAFIDFILAGNTITIISGNHDLELYFPEVQQAFKDFLLNRLEARYQDLQEEQLSAEERQNFCAAISFECWFTAQPGYYHIEHGHQYDAMCSVNDPLLPLCRLQPPLAAVPLFQRLTPYIADILPNFSSHNIENMDYTNLLKQLSLREKAALLHSLKQALGDLAKEMPEDNERLLHTALLGARAKFANHCLYGQPVLNKLHHGHQAPFEVTFRQFTAALLRPRDIPSDLKAAALNSSLATGARVIIYSHTHLPELCIFKNQAGQTLTYINSGSWVSREVANGETGIGQTFAVVTPEKADLYQWIGGKQDFDALPYRRYALEKRGPA